MHVGMALHLQNMGNLRDDSEVYSNEIRLASLAEPLGFESIWAVEHHFTDYVLIPDPLLLLTYLAGKTTRVELGTMVVVLPWHEPVRVAENAAMLDNLCGGRFLLGIGRGLGRVEFDGFAVPMHESRDRFVEAGTMILNALEDGYIEGKGPHYPRQRRDIRPRPVRSFKGRTFAASVSPESALIMAELGVGLVYVPQKPWQTVADDFQAYASRYAEVQHEAPPAPLINAYVFCDESEDRAQTLAHEYVGNYYRALIDHYEMGESHFATTNGYDYYQRMSDNIRHDTEGAINFFLALQVFGTPEQCYDKVLGIHQLVENDRFLGTFSYGNMPYGDAEKSLRLFANEVAPALQAFDATSTNWRSTVKVTN
jgi:alkanesulfonate monooxygenase SsuD/methylene tetrahydromethanopterin reductase-like flavin-dependent oxidoreductase (luciferase family)